MNRRKVVLSLLIVLAIAISCLFIYGSPILPWPSTSIGMTPQQVAAEASSRGMDYFVFGKNDEFIVVSQKQQRCLSVTKRWMMIEFDAKQGVSNIRYKKIATGL